MAMINRIQINAIFSFSIYGALPIRLIIHVDWKDRLNKNISFFLIRRSSRIRLASGDCIITFLSIIFRELSTKHFQTVQILDDQYLERKFLFFFRKWKISIITTMDSIF